MKVARFEIITKNIVDYFYKQYKKGVITYYEYRSCRDTFEFANAFNKKYELLKLGK